MKKTIAVVLFCLLSFVGSSGFALDLGIYAQAAYSNLHTLRQGGLFGPGGSVGVQLQLTDYWGIAADAGGSYHFENSKDELPATSVGFTSLQLRYYADVFEYVPYFSVGPTFYFAAPEASDQASSLFGAKFTIGMDKRLDRSWSVGFQGDIFALATDLNRYPIYSMVGLRVVRHFRL